MTTPLLRLATRLMVVPLVLIGVYLFWRGHNAPGGGFIGGLLIAVAIALRGLTTPPHAPLRFPPASVLLGAGLSFAVLTTVVPLAFGAPLLTAYDVHLHPPLIGDLHLTTSLVFDLGVAFVVVGLLWGILDALSYPAEDLEVEDLEVEEGTP